MGAAREVIFRFGLVLIIVNSFYPCFYVQITDADVNKSLLVSNTLLEWSKTKDTLSEILK